MDAYILRKGRVTSAVKNFSHRVHFTTIGWHLLWNCNNGKTHFFPQKILCYRIFPQQNYNFMCHTGSLYYIFVYLKIGLIYLLPLLCNYNLSKFIQRNHYKLYWHICQIKTLTSLVILANCIAFTSDEMVNSESQSPSIQK